MSGILSHIKTAAASALLQLSGHFPESKRRLKQLAGIKYFLTPGTHQKNLRHFLMAEERQHPEIRYPLTEERYGNGKLAVITGATSGIGKEFARCFARQGYDLLITGRRREKIAAVADEIRREFGVNVKVVMADMSVREDMMSLLQIVDMQHNIEVLVNNAGYGMSLGFSEDGLDHQLDMMKVHVNAPLMLIHKVLPKMIEKRAGIIINVSSMATYFPVSGSTMYVSTKSFLKSFTESLFLDVGRYGIRVQCLCPGFTSSDFHRNSNIISDGKRHRLIPWMEPPAVVDYSLQCLNKGKIICIPGLANRLLILLVSVMPRNLYYRLSLILEKIVRQQKEIPCDASYSVNN